MPEGHSKWGSGIICGFESLSYWMFSLLVILLEYEDWVVLVSIPNCKSVACSNDPEDIRHNTFIWASGLLCHRVLKGSIICFQNKRSLRQRLAWLLYLGSLCRVQCTGSLLVAEMLTWAPSQDRLVQLFHSFIPPSVLFFKKKKVSIMLYPVVYCHVGGGWRQLVKVFCLGFYSLVLFYLDTKCCPHTLSSSPVTSMLAYFTRNCLFPLASSCDVVNKDAYFLLIQHCNI